MAFEKLRTIVITAIPKPRSRERFRKMPKPPQLAFLRTRRLTLLAALSTPPGVVSEKALALSRSFCDRFPN
jgi:hypothetical protein